MAEYGIYKAIQDEETNHVYVYENYRFICHINCDKKKTDEELVDMIKTVLVLMEG